MKVALIGAAGSNKTKIANRIARRLNKNSEWQWKVIDGYIEKLRNRTGLQYDIESDYLQNLEILTTRTMLEQEALLQDKHTITCGTIYETMIHTAIFTLGIRYLRDEQAIALENQTAQFIMGAMGVLESRYFDYNVLFYLPLKDEERTWEYAVDAKIPEVLEGAFKQAVTLDDETDKKKVDHAFEIIRNVQVGYAITQDNQQRSGSHPADSEREEHQTG